MKMDGSNENSKGPWISKNLSHSFITIFRKKLWRGFWAQPLPLLQNHYCIKPYPPSLINFEKKSSRKFMVPSPLHIKIKIDIYFSFTNFWREEMEEFLVPSHIDKTMTLKPFVHKNEKKIIFFFLLIFWKEKFEGILVPPTLKA
jgi:hypothetical protein